MTTTELKREIAESKSKGWFQSRTLKLNYPYLKYEMSLTGLAAVYDYTIKLGKHYNEFLSLPQELLRSKRRFEELKLAIIQLVNDDKEDDHKWKTSTSAIFSPTNKIIPSDTSEFHFLAKLHLNNPNYYPSAYAFVIGDLSGIGKNQLMGYLLAYEFEHADISEISERSKVEQKNIQTIRSDFQKQVLESQTQLIEVISDGNEKVNVSSQNFENLLTTKKSDFENWFQESNDNLKSFIEQTTNRISEIESLYKEKLKLEAPAKYWSERATKLRKEGRMWLLALIASIGVGVLVLIWVLNMIAGGTLTQIFTTTATAIKWSVALITLISFIAYAIRIISKLAFSAFHLVRDAEEREQLTYVYLALQKEKGIDQTERHLIMQSLFSRADSGLLRDDSGPTMPGNIIDQVTKR